MNEFLVRLGGESNGQGSMIKSHTYADEFGIAIFLSELSYHMAKPNIAQTTIGRAYHMEVGALGGSNHEFMICPLLQRNVKKP